MQGAKVRILEQRDEISLDGLLERTNSGGLEAQIGLVLLGNLTDEALERQLADKQLGTFLVLANFTESNGTGLITMRLLNAGGSMRAGCTLASNLRGNLFTGRLATGSTTVYCRLGAGHMGWVSKVRSGAKLVIYTPSVKVET